MSLAEAMAPAKAFEECLQITRQEAKNFYYGIRLLRPPKRQAMAALYALARRIDDIGDGSDTPEAKQMQLGKLRRQLDNLAACPELARDPVLAGVAHAANRFPIPIAAFGEIIAGCEQDTDGFVYETIDDTVRYCRLVAGSVGRLSLGVFGSSDWEVDSALADDLGVALQLTNILRDITEDAQMGRVYLPREDLERFGCAADLSGPRPAVAKLVLFEAERAQQWFARGFELLGRLDRRSRACVSAMSGIYFRLLTHICRQPDAVLDRRVSVPTSEKAWVAAKSLAGLRP